MTISDIPLLETKLYPPKWCAEQVSRPRLIECMRYQRKLTLVSAPAGFGKTTLLAEWIIALSTRSVAWVSLDKGDNTPVMFWTYLIYGLHQIQPSIGGKSLALLQSVQPPEIESVLMTLLNELNMIEEEITLILDDYHTIETQVIHEGISFLLSHLPPHVHLVIASRTDPPLSLARLRSHGDLTELRVNDLRFTPEEASAFLGQVMRLDISADNISALEQRTEGWIAGLKLAALSMQGHENIPGFISDFSGDDRYIVDYLLEEVLQRQSNRVRRFLLQTAILDRLSSSLCNAITKQNDGQEMLETLERCNLFVIPLDNKRQWYRYHHLFADVLQAHALMEGPEQIPRLHKLASHWYEEHHLFSDAIRHSLDSQDFERAATLIEQVWPIMRSRQQETTVQSWLKVLPTPLIRSRPILSVVYALVLLHTGPLDAVEMHLQDAEYCLEQDVDVSPSQAEQYQSLPASIANARAFCAQIYGDFTGAITHAKQALDLLPNEHDNERGVTSAFLGLAYWTSGDVAAAHQSFADGLMLFQKRGSIQIAVCGTSGLAYMGMAQGLLQETIKTCEQALQLAAQQSEPVLRGTADLYLALCEIRYEQGDLAVANDLLHKGEALRKQGSISGADYLWWLVKAQLTAAQGDFDTAQRELKQAALLYRRSPIPNVRPIEALKVRWYLKQGRLSDALSWVKESGLALDDEPEYLHEYEHLTLGRVLIAHYRSDSDNQIDPIIGLLNRLLAAAGAKERTGSIIKIRVVLALAYEAKGELPKAITSLEKALILAETEGYVRIFAECGTPMARLLQEAVNRGITPTYSQKLLTHLRHWEQKAKPASGLSQPPSSHALLEPLSPRELDVLRLLNTELSGPEIARELVVALSTVRTHTKRIYSKLNVTNRRAAVKRAAELNLI